MKPFWREGEVYRETFAMVEEDGYCEAPFLLPPEKVLKVESYSGEKVYEEGSDYLVRGDKLILPEGSRIPHTGWERFLCRTEEESQKALEEKGISLDFGCVATTDGNFLNLCAIGNPRFVTDFQVAVTYRAKEGWQGQVPKGAMADLPGLSGKIREKKAVTVVLYGDSISCGWDCSGKYGFKPGQPVWPSLVLHQAEKKWKVPIRFHNTSVSGMDTEWAITHARERAGNYHPDLVILGFGMNDRCDGKEYGAKTRRLIKEIRKDSPETEFLLIATTLPNRLADTEPLHFWAYQEEQAENLRKLCGKGVVLADVQGMQVEIEKKKRYLDLTGNLLNHPNDYLARVQAQVIAAVLELEGD